MALGAAGGVGSPANGQRIDRWAALGGATVDDKGEQWFWDGPDDDHDEDEIGIDWRHCEIPLVGGGMPFVLGNCRYIDDDSDEKPKTVWRQEIARTRRRAYQKLRRVMDECQTELERFDREYEELLHRLTMEERFEEIKALEESRKKVEEELRRDEENPPQPLFG